MPKAINFEKTKGLMKMVQDPNFDKFAKQAAAGNPIDFNLDESTINGGSAPMLNSLPTRGTEEYQQAYATVSKTINEGALSKFPKEIRDSFKQIPPVMDNQLSESTLSAVNGLADLDKLFGGNVPKMPINENKPPVQTIKPLGGNNNSGFSFPQINEVKNNYQAPAPNNGGVIDYSVLRAIIKDIVNEALDSKLKERENLDCIMIGKTIKLLTKDGNLYEGKLELKQNINNK